MAPVVVLLWMPLAVSVTVRTTPGMTEPLGSETVPEMLPVTAPRNAAVWLDNRAILNNCAQNLVVIALVGGSLNIATSAGADHLSFGYFFDARRV